MWRLFGMTASSVSLFSLHLLHYFDVAAGIDTTVTERRQPNYYLPFSIRESYWIYGGCANTSKKVFLYTYLEILHLKQWVELLCAMTEVCFASAGLEIICFVTGRCGILLESVFCKTSELHISLLASTLHQVIK